MKDDATIAIVGVGLIGGSLGLAFKRVGAVRRVIGVSRSETVERAVALGAIDDGVDYGALSAGVAEADAVFLCTPISRILELLPETLAVAKEGSVVTDVGSTKQVICECAREHARSGVVFVGGHPMAGSEGRGIEAADPFLFQNAIYVLTPNDGDEEAAEGLGSLLSVTGARTLVLDASTHDTVVSAISHLPQLLATSLVGMVGRLDTPKGLALRMAAGGFRDMTRIASSPYEMWRDICLTNIDAIRNSASLLHEALEGVLSRLESDALAEDFSFAQKTRAAIPTDGKGFLTSLHDLRLMVEDRPGVIAEIGSTLADAEINIRDFEILKVREGEGGSIRLAFGSEEDAAEARRLLEACGMTVLV